MPKLNGFSILFLKIRALPQPPPLMHVHTLVVVVVGKPLILGRKSAVNVKLLIVDVLSQPELT